MNRIFLGAIALLLTLSASAQTVVVSNKPSPKAALSKDGAKFNGVNLGGVMRAESVDDIDFTKPQLVQVDGSRSYVAYLSKAEWNHISLPFVPLGGKSYDDIEINFINDQSRNVYVRFIRNAEVHLFLESEDGDVVSLQLIPKDVMAQQVVVSMNTTKAGAKRDFNDYVTTVQDIMQAAALGRRPPQFSESLLEYPSIVYNGLHVTTQKVYSTNAYTLFSYKVINPSDQPTTVSEAEFDGEDVAAVSVYPGPELVKGKPVDVFVLTKNRKEAK